MKKGNFLNSMIGSKLSKVLITTAVASLSLCFSAYSQDDNDPSDIIKAEEESDVGKLWFGARAGVTMSSFGNNTSSFDLSDGPGTLNSFTGGIFARYQALEWLAIQPEVSYLQTGANGLSYTETNSTANFFSGPYESTRGTAQIDGRVMLNTVDASLNAVFTPKNFLPKLRPYFVFGTSYGFIINARTREQKDLQFPGSGTTVSVINTVDNTSNYRIFDFGLNYAVGSQFNIFGNTGFVEVRYRWGISNISNFTQFRIERDLDGDGIPETPSSLTNKSFSPQDLTNHTLMVTTGIMFGGKSMKKKGGDMEDDAAEASEE